MFELENLAWIVLRDDDSEYEEISENGNIFIKESSRIIADVHNENNISTVGYWARLINEKVMPESGTSVSGYSEWLEREIDIILRKNTGL